MVVTNSGSLEVPATNWRASRKPSIIGASGWMVLSLSGRAVAKGLEAEEGDQLALAKISFVGWSRGRQTQRAWRCRRQTGGP